MQDNRVASMPILHANPANTYLSKVNSIIETLEKGVEYVRS